MPAFPGAEAFQDQCGAGIPRTPDPGPYNACMGRSMNKLAWCAGIIDGEGCIRIHKRKPGAKSQPRQKSNIYYLDLKVKMVHKPAIEILHSFFRCGDVHSEQPGKSNKRIAWRWNVFRRDAASVLKKVLPFLVVKRKEALLAIEFQESPLSGRIGNGLVSEDSAAFREDCYQRMRMLKCFEWKE